MENAEREWRSRDPLTRGADAVGLVVLGLVTLLLTAVALICFERRDLRA